jgi:hypothetical protein
MDHGPVCFQFSTASEKIEQGLPNAAILSCCKKNRFHGHRQIIWEAESIRMPARRPTPPLGPFLFIGHGSSTMGSIAQCFGEKQEAKCFDFFASRFSW